MTLTSVAKQTLNTKTLVPILLAAVAFIVSRMAGTWAMKYHPLLRYAPGLLLVGAGVAYGARKEGGHLYGLGVSVGAGVDLALTGAERFGFLARIGVK